MNAEFEINDLGKFSYFCDLEFVKVKEGTITYQQKCIVGLLAKNSISHGRMRKHIETRFHFMNEMLRILDCPTNSQKT